MFPHGPRPQSTSETKLDTHLTRSPVFELHKGRGLTKAERSALLKHKLTPLGAGDTTMKKLADSHLVGKQMLPYKHTGGWVLSEGGCDIVRQGDTCFRSLSSEPRGGPRSEQARRKWLLNE